MLAMRPSSHSMGRCGLPCSPVRRMLGAVGLALLGFGTTSPLLADDPQLRSWVETLAQPDLEGRLAGSPGERQAAEYLANELAALGLVPLPGVDGFLQPFEFTAGVRDAGSTIAIRNPAGDLVVDRAAGEGVQALSFSDDGEVEGELVFAGYGLEIPEREGFPYDSFFGLDLEGKIAVVLRYFPEDTEQGTRAILSRYAGLRYKALHARERGAVGMIVVTGPRSPNAGALVPMTFDTAIAGSGLVAASLDGTAAAAIFAGGDRSLEEIQEALDTANPHETGFAMPGMRARLTVSVERERRQGTNVVGYLAANAEDAGHGPILLLGAHFDHLGRGGHGNSLAGKEEAGLVHPGADDNASGTAALLGVARDLGKIVRRQSVAFAFWSGEELGLLGSAHFVREPIIPHAFMSAYINLDMVGRSRDNRLVVQAVGSSDGWSSLLERANVPVGFDLGLQQDPYLPTDSSSFNGVGIPNLNLFTGSHEDYHRPGDSADKINYEDLERVVQFTTLLVRRLDALEKPLEFSKVAQTTEAGPARDAVRAFTGTIPDYATEVEGLLLGGVMEGGPADEGGLRKGDIIVRFGSQEIANIYDYTYALEAVKIDVPLEVVFVRDGETLSTTITPRARN